MLGMRLKLRMHHGDLPSPVMLRPLQHHLDTTKLCIHREFNQADSDRVSNVMDRVNDMVKVGNWCRFSHYKLYGPDGCLCVIFL